MSQRVIIHVDMDAFFASVEQMDNPKLKGKPVIVGGNSPRGVVSTCSYEARIYGVRSAMPIFIAKQLCPGGIYLAVRHKRYEEISHKVFNILHSVTDLVEPVSIDEAYLDVSTLKDNPVEIVNMIKKRVRESLGLTLSAGISYNKFLAKTASEWNKPNGLKVITEDMVPEILKPLPIKKVHGIGEKSIEKLNEIGIYTIGQLLNLTEDEMVYYFGKYGVEIYNKIRGYDNRPICLERETKSVGRETTFDNDTTDKSFLKAVLLDFAQELAGALDEEALFAKTVTVKFKTDNFKTHTRSKTLKKYINTYGEIKDTAFDILDDYNINGSIRLIGLSLSNFSDASYEQLSFFDLPDS
ncbi:DNA polymerase IV [Lutispora sp.]|uniref:DNA polymerase IV n=1 Tax=Lutispora sp. TaxID=2828727 RepID=UPI002B1F9264|nr:DNA polymerase IV [Lutispora sp.]MEA4960681.1 DNA polymerase IV [Lutispora sp.]